MACLPAIFLFFYHSPNSLCSSLMQPLVFFQHIKHASHLRSLHFLFLLSGTFSPRYFHIPSPSSFRSWFKCLSVRFPISTFHKIASLHTHTHSILILLLIFFIALPKLHVIYLTCQFLICFYLLQRGRKEGEKNSVMREDQ